MVTKNTDWQPEEVFVSNNIESAIEKAKESDAKEIFIIGGGEIFKQTMDKVSRIHPDIVYKFPGFFSHTSNV